MRAPIAKSSLDDCRACVKEISGMQLVMGATRTHIGKLTA